MSKLNSNIYWPHVTKKKKGKERKKKMERKVAVSLLITDKKELTLDW